MKGEGVKAQYVRLRRRDSDRKNYASIRSFVVNPLTVDNLGFAVEAENPQQVLSAFDGNLNTSFQQHGSLVMEVKNGVKGYTFLTNTLSQPVRVKQFDAQGTQVAETSFDSPFAKIELADENVAKISVEGTAEIFEIIPEISASPARSN